MREVSPGKKMSVKRRTSPLIFAITYAIHCTLVCFFEAHNPIHGKKLHYTLVVCKHVSS